MTKTSRSPGSISRQCAAVFARMVSNLEGLFWGKQGPKEPPLFILGLPRAGSTLFFHSLCHCFETAHLTKLSQYMWFAPTLASWLIKRFGSRYRSDYESHYGIGNSLASPFSSNVWNLWFEKNAFYGADDISHKGAVDAVRAIGRIERVFDRPFVDKNHRFNQWLPALNALCPNALFLIIVRDPVSVALSMLRARKELFGRFGYWLHEKPLSYAAPDNATNEQQVVYQVRGILDDMRNYMETIGPKRFVIIHYEDLCNNPQGTLDSLHEYLKRNGLDLKQTQQITETFKLVAARTDGLSSEQITNIKKAAAEAFPDGTIGDFPCVTIGASCNED